MNEHVACKLSESRKWIEISTKMQQKAVSNGKTCAYTYLAGPPGIGKSELFEQICAEKGWGLVVKYMGTLQIEQITGLPKATEQDNNFTQWTIPEIFNFKNLRVEPNPRTNDQPIILLLDDAHLCNKTIQSYMFQLLTYRCIHDHILPDNVAIFLAGNRSEDAANFQQILAPITNRIDFKEVYAEVDDWIKNFAIKNNVRRDIISYLQKTEGSFQTTPVESQAWASPRSWTNASFYMDEAENQLERSLNNDEILNILSGHVGMSQATGFVEFKEYLQKWEADRILTGELQKPDVRNLNRIECYALMTALSNEFIRFLNEENFSNNKRTKQYFGNNGRGLFRCNIGGGNKEAILE